MDDIMDDIMFEYEGYFDFFNLPIYTDRISELIQAKILKNPSLSLVKT